MSNPDTTWRYTASSQEVVRSDGVLIARDVPPEFGPLIAAAYELRDAVQFLAIYAEVQVRMHPNAIDTPDWRRLLDAIARARP